MDEAATLFAASPLFSELAMELARNIRKVMGAVMFAFQDADGMGETANVLLQSSANFIFFRDPSVDRKQLKELFSLSEADIDFITDNDHASRHLRRVMLFVRKRDAGVESVPVDVSLAGLGKYLNLFRSGVDAVALMEAMTRQHGEERWISPYLERLQSS